MDVNLIIAILGGVETIAIHASFTALAISFCYRLVIVDWKKGKKELRKIAGEVTKDIHS